MKIGAQMYTVREYTKNLDDLSETLKKLKDMGYNYVQVSGTCPYEAKWMAETLDKYGMACPVTHFDPNKILDDTKNVVDFHNQFGCKHIGIGYTAVHSEEDYEKLKVRLRKATEIAAEKGSMIMVHNHAFEFTTVFDGKNVMEHFDEDFATNELGFILDVYWAKNAGKDPCEVIQKYAGRLSCVHLKDLAPVGDEKRFAPVGDGIIDFKQVLKELKIAGCEYAFVEQDDCYGEDPFKCLKRSYDHLVELGAEF